MATHPFVLSLTAARIADLHTIVGTEDIAEADEVWEAGIAAVAAGLAADEGSAPIRGRLWAAWRAADLGYGVSVASETWKKVWVAYDGAINEVGLTSEEISERRRLRAE